LRRRERVETDSPGRHTLDRQARELATLAERIWTALLDPARSAERARACLAAADRLLALTETRL
jgi:hypothetical protein